jgi:hypothetical protein
MKKSRECMTSMFKSSLPIKNCILFEFKTQKDLALSFCRVEEYYEGNEKIRGQYLLMETFIDHFMDDDGKINYFHYWTGFNIPGDVFSKWFKMHASDKSKWETALAEEVSKKIDFTKPFYVIGGKKGDMNVIDHELAHALYFMDKAYAAEMSEVTFRFCKEHRKDYNKVVKKLKKMGYGENVIADEVQAYMSTSTKKELVEKFDIDFEGTKSIRTEFRKVLSKYNTYKKKS